jgi:hypothetical protein
MSRIVTFRNTHKSQPVLIGNADFETSIFKTNAAQLNPPVTLPNGIWHAATEIAFSCLAAKQAKFRRQHNIPTWRYRYFGDFPNMRLFPGSGAYHASEVPIVWGTSADVSGDVDTPEEAAISSYMRKIWTSFAKDPRNGLQALGLKQYDPNPNGESASVGILVAD